VDFSQAEGACAGVHIRGQSSMEKFGLQEF